MDLRMIETSVKSISNFDYFAVDFSGKNISLNGKDYPLGKVPCDIANLSKDYVSALLASGSALYSLFVDFNKFGFSKEIFINMKKKIMEILDLFIDVPPFCYFDIEDSRRIVNTVFSDEVIENMRKHENSEKAKEEQRMVFEFVKIYTYLPSDIANFGMVVQNFTQYLIAGHARNKNELAKLALAFFTNKDILEEIDKHNPFPFIQGVTLRPRQTGIPVIPYAGGSIDNLEIHRRIYYGRLMDFFISELFEALSNGHYVWQCKVCGKYFLMKSAHRQYYCGQYNPEYGTTCDHVANNRRLGRNKGLVKQKRKDNPLWVVRNQRYASIRKNKSLGKYNETVSDEAKRILDERFELAEIDPDYADNHYVDDITLENIYAEAIKRIK